MYRDGALVRREVSLHQPLPILISLIRSLSLLLQAKNDWLIAISPPFRCRHL